MLTAPPTAGLPEPETSGAKSTFTLQVGKRRPGEGKGQPRVAGG